MVTPIHTMKRFELNGLAVATQEIHHNFQVARIVDVAHHDFEVSAIQKEFTEELENYSCTWAVVNEKRKDLQSLAFGHIVGLEELIVLREHLRQM